MGDPVDWAAWGYGKFGVWGLVSFLVCFNLILTAGIGAVMWRGVEKYRSEHPDVPEAPQQTRVDTVGDVEGALSPVRQSEYRKLVADVLHAMEPTALITVGGEVLGPDGARKVDVQVWSAANRDAGPTIIDVIDVPDGRPVDIDAVDLIHAKRADLPVRAALVSSNTGFTREAISKGKRTGVGLIAVLRDGDKRAAVIEEEVFLRTVTVNKTGAQYRHKGQSRRNIAAGDVKYRGVPIDGWLYHRLMLALGGIGKDVKAALYYRLKTPIDFEAPGGKLRNVARIETLIDVSVKWASQVVRINAKNAIYDYVRGRVRLGVGTQSTYEMKFDWDTATPLSEPPEVGTFAINNPNDQLAQGEVDVAFFRIHGMPSKPAPTPSKEIDALIEPDDLKAEFEILGMKARP